MRSYYTLMLFCLATSLAGQSFTDTIVLYDGFGNSNSWDYTVVVEGLGDNVPDIVSPAPDAVVLINRNADGSLAIDSANVSVFNLDNVLDINGDGLIDLIDGFRVNYGITADSFTQDINLPKRPALMGDFTDSDFLDFFSITEVVFDDDMVSFHAAQADGSYLETIVDTVTRAETAATGDVNNDGNLDFCYFGDISGPEDILSCFYGDGMGNFTKEDLFNDQTSDGFMVLADLNGDDFPEAIMPQRLFPGLKIVVNDNGSFLNAQFITVDNDDDRYKALKVADLDGDGDNDIVALIQMSNEIEEQVIVYINDGNGNFGPQTALATVRGSSLNSFPANQGDRQLYVKDIDGDFFPDIIVNAFDAGKTYVLFNTLTSSTSNPGPVAFKELTVFPNPVGANQSLQLNFGNGSPTLRSFIVLDALGRKMPVNLNIGNTELVTEQFPQGQYLIVAQTEKGVFYRARFIK